MTLAVAIGIPVLFLGVAQMVSTPGLYERAAHAIAFVWMLAVSVPIILRPELSTDPLSFPESPG